MTRLVSAALVVIVAVRWAGRRAVRGLLELEPGQWGGELR